MSLIDHMELTISHRLWIGCNLHNLWTVSKLLKKTWWRLLLWSVSRVKFHFLWSSACLKTWRLLNCNSGKGAWNSPYSYDAAFDRLYAQGLITLPDQFENLSQKNARQPGIPTPIANIIKGKGIVLKVVGLLRISSKILLFRNLL